VNIIFEVNTNFDIIFIQELSWSTICSLSSSQNYEGESLVGIINYPNWLTFARTSESKNDFPRVVIYVNIRLSSFCFSLCKDVINYRDILLEYLKDTEAYI